VATRRPADGRLKTCLSPAHKLTFKEWNKG
jgi:hypothetical protein